MNHALAVRFEDPVLDAGTADVHSSPFADLMHAGK